MNSLLTITSFSIAAQILILNLIISKMNTNVVLKQNKCEM